MNADSFTHCTTAYMASVICECGKTSGTFLKTKPVSSLECFCSDCGVRAVKVRAGLNGESSDATDDDKTPVLLQFFSGKVRVVNLEDGLKNGDALTFCKMRRKTWPMIMACAKCCGSLLFSDHFSYEGNKLVMSPDTQKVSHNFFRVPPAGRIWIKDWPAEKFTEYEKKHPIQGGYYYLDHSTGDFVLTGSLGDPDVAKAEALKQMNDCKDDAFKTFQQLLDMVGGIAAVVDLRVPEGERSAKKQDRVLKE